MEFIKREKDLQDAKMLSPLVWAYVGDSVYELFVRTKLTNNSNAKPHKLHIEATKFVKAAAQAKILQQLENELTEEEKEVVRRARNTKNHHLPKNSNVREYMYATAFEGLIGYLYLTGKTERLEEILKRCI